ncbi:hypothetical protein NB311A_14642 [Nitrobacter sp. Nb-311A]|nr:hypothetical protein NB311A_14642 [Nitrobacter sp. Nb-311A]
MKDGAVMSRIPAHDPPKCRRFGDRIMRHISILERDRTKMRYPLFLIALWREPC